MKKLTSPYVNNATSTNMTIANTRPSFVNAGTFLMIRNSIAKRTIGYSSQMTNTYQMLMLPPPSVLALVTSALRMYIAKYSQTSEHRYYRAPAKVPERTAQQIGIDLLLRVGIEAFLDRNVYEVEKVEQADPGDAGDEVEPAQHDSRRVRRHPGALNTS